jgi:hypothetical protein
MSKECLSWLIYKDVEQQIYSKRVQTLMSKTHAVIFLAGSKESIHLGCCSTSPYQRQRN